MSRKIQQELTLQNEKSMIGKPFGGSNLKSHPKVKRPFSSKHQIHLILKSSLAKGVHSMLHPKNVDHVNRLVRRFAIDNGIQLQNYVNVGNHLHLLVKCRHRRQLARFLRTISGLIPRRILGCQRGNPLATTEKFWDARPFTKIMASGRRTFQIIRRYFDKNRWQALNRVEGFDYFPFQGTG
ncbi:MAG: transposase [Bdellovibrionales bacterium]|nr:transposase [Bdellovibrionales bacterium]